MSEARVAFDLTQGMIGRIGTSVYIRELRRALQRRLGDRLVPIASRWARPVEGASRTAGQRAATLGRDLWWHQVGVVIAARRRGCRLLHLPGNVGPVGPHSLPLVATIHDIMPLRFPELFRPWFRRYAALVMPRFARRARAVIAVSQATKDEIVHRLGVAPERITVIPHGVDAACGPRPPDDPTLPALRRRYDLPERYVLAVGSVEPRKNLPRVLEAVRLLRDGSPAGARDVAFVHCGPEGFRPADVARVVHSLGLNGTARFLGYVPADDLRSLYAGARALVFPSLWEGFGLPVLEAMACGCPVITSNVSSLPEVAGGAAVLVDPQSVEAIAAALARVWVDDRHRDDLVRRGLAHAARFTWEAAARATAAVYETALA
ncbi:MAG: glycosyltransferase family 4 protein [Gemmatimonadales bacterium]